MFRNIAELKKHLSGVQKNLSHDTIMPFVEQAAIKHIIPYIGHAFYEEILGEYMEATEEAPMSVENQLVCTLIQRSLAYYTLLEAMPFLMVSVGNIGVQEVSSDNSSPVRQWNYNNLEIATASNADAFLDNLLRFLEASSLDEYTTWRDSPEFSISKELFINSTQELSMLVPIANSRRAFLTLRPYISRAEELYILPILGTVLFDELKTFIKSGEANAEKFLLIEKIKKAVGQYALIEGLPEITVQLTAAGLKVVSDNDGLKHKVAATSSEISARISKATDLANVYMSMLKQFLDANVATFESYKESEYFIKSEGKKKSYQLRDNSNSTSFRV